MRSRLTVLTHVWPGITPFNARDLEWRDWVMYAAACDEWIKARKEASRG